MCCKVRVECVRVRNACWQVCGLHCQTHLATVDVALLFVWRWLWVEFLRGVSTRFLREMGYEEEAGAWTTSGIGTTSSSRSSKSRPMTGRAN